MKKRIFLIAILAMLVALPALAGTTTGQNAGSGIMLSLGIGAVGLVLNASTLIALQKSFKAIFQEAVEAIQPAWTQVAMEAPSDTAEENYQWLGDVPAIREWLGDKVIKELKGFQYTLRNKDWESTIGVDRNNIEDDQLGLYRPRIQQLADEGMRHPDELVSTVRVAGTSAACYDGSYFYLATHSMGKSGTLSNLLGGTGHTLTTVAVDFITARAALRKFKTDTGRPFIRRAGKLDLKVTCPPDLEGVFEALATSTMIGTSDNTLKGAFTYIVDPYLTDPTDWYLDYVGSPVKPFVVQMRKRPQFVGMDDPTAEKVFMQKKFLYSVEARYNVGYGLWQYSIKTTNT